MQTLPIWSAALFSEYLGDAFQRTAIFLDVLRQRGDEQAEMTRRPFSSVFAFEHEIVLSGKTLPRPINYYLGRILPPDDCTINPDKAPVVVIDPRAGQGPGISGFKSQSEVGVSMREGHPVYFIGFAEMPVPGQTFLDVIDGQVEFLKQVVKLHPESPKPIAIGNCQAGYQTLMAAMLSPDLFGSVIMAGSPMSYWQGVHGKNPMRYTGGMEGGSWLTALASDLGNGQFDGANLIASFDNLKLDNFLWGKQYKVYANIDQEPERYLGFEKWWGDFILLNGEEIQYLVDQLFIGNQLTANTLSSNDNHTFDLRNIKAPIICFTSMGDHISPPQQALGWILDLYRSVEEIRERGQTIVYCLDSSAGHLAIFVSAKVAVKEDAAFVRTIDLLDCLPPGLYEMVLTPNAAEKKNGCTFIATFERRTLDDIRAFGRNSRDDDRAFETVSRLSNLNLSAYRTFVQPLVRAVANEPMANLLRWLHPLRLSYSVFASSNPAMSVVEPLAEMARTQRTPIEPDNPYWVLQNLISEQTENVLNFWGQVRDQMVETCFFSIYGSPWVQGVLGTNAETSWSREPPALSPAEEESFEKARDRAKSKIRKATSDEILVRAVLFVLCVEKRFDERVGAALYNLALQQFHMNPEGLKQVVYEQALLLHIDQKAAIQALPDLLKAQKDRLDLMKLVTKLISAEGPLKAEEKRRLDEMNQLFSDKKLVKKRSKGGHA